MEKASTPYSYIWHKYRPVILRLMVNASEAPQKYEFSDHEFKRIFPKNKTSLAFIIYVNKVKALNNIKSSPLAHALLEILQQSKTAISLTEHDTYELMLDRNFTFHVRKSNNEHVRESMLSSLEIEACNLN